MKNGVIMEFLTLFKYSGSCLNEDSRADSAVKIVLGEGLKIFRAMKLQSSDNERSYYPSNDDVWSGKSEFEGEGAT